jgi:hypothetical protein
MSELIIQEEDRGASPPAQLRAPHVMPWPAPASPQGLLVPTPNSDISLPQYSASLTPLQLLFPRHITSRMLEVSGSEDPSCCNLYCVINTELPQKSPSCPNPGVRQGTWAGGVREQEGSRSLSSGP